PELGLALADEPRSDRDHRDPDGHVDEEDPGPAESARQRTAEEDARGASTTGRRAPDTEREIPLAPLAERRRQDRERSRREHGGAEALQRAEADQRRFRPRQAVEQR